MDSSNVLQASVLRFGVFELDCRAGELRKSGVLIHLPPQPFNVLALLASHAGQIVTRESIRRQIWGDETYVDFERGLNQCVSQIRTALGDDAEAPRYIETLARRGYRFLGPVEHIDPASSAAGGEESASGVKRAASSRRRVMVAVPWALAVVGVFGCVVLTFVMTRRPTRPGQEGVVSFSVFPPENSKFPEFAGQAVPSPDGSRLAFVTGPSGEKPCMLWVRPLDSLVAQSLPGTEWARSPFWSPDGRYLGFFTDDKLKKVAISGGPVQTLCNAYGASATWNRQGVIFFLDGRTLYSVPETGGEPSLVAGFDAAHRGIDLQSLQFLPDGRHFLFGARRSGGEGPFIGVGSLDSKPTERLLSTTSNAIYAPQGYLLYIQQNSLIARRFDAGRLQFTGEAVPILQIASAGVVPGDEAELSISESAILAYRSWSGGMPAGMVWFDRKGRKLGTVGQPGVYTNPALSPDGTKVAVGLGVSGERDIWVYDLKRGTGSRLTRDPADDLNPVWSHDGSTIMFTSTRHGQRDLYRKSANGLGSTQLVYASKELGKSLMDWSPNSRYALCEAGSSVENLWAFPLFGNRKPFAFVEGNFFAQQGRFSPDGRYVAHTSGETGQPEVYVQTFPQHLGKWAVSNSGGMEPMWRRDGKELFYIRGDNTLMSVDVNPRSGGFHAGIPKPLFQVQIITGAGWWRNRYAVSPDGQQFLMLVPVSQANPEPITVVVNWPALLKNAGR